MRLEKLILFNDILLRFQKVERVVRVPGDSRWENDSEHSYQLAMLVWYIAVTDELPLDVEKVVKYGLVHDLVEVYAGDTYLFGSSEELSRKKIREAEAARRLREAFPDFGELHMLVERYEGQSDAEAVFVHALDKVVPMLNIYADGGRTWREKNITLALLVEKKEPILKHVPELKLYFDELVAVLRKKPDLFPV